MMVSIEQLRELRMYSNVHVLCSLSLLPPPPHTHTPTTLVSLVINDIADSEDLLSSEDEESDNCGFEQDSANQTTYLVSSKVKGKQLNKKSMSGKTGVCVGGDVIGRWVYILFLTRCVSQVSYVSAM